MDSPRMSSAISMFHANVLPMCHMRGSFSCNAKQREGAFHLITKASWDTAGHKGFFLMDIRITASGIMHTPTGGQHRRFLNESIFLDFDFFSLAQFSSWSLHNQAIFSFFQPSTIR